VPKSGHVTRKKIENLHIEMEILHIEVEISPIQKLLSFSIYDENNKVISEKNHFRTVESPGACGVFSMPQLCNEA